MPEVKRMNFEEMSTEEIKAELDSVTKANKKLEKFNSQLKERLNEFESDQETKFGALIDELKGIRKELEETKEHNVKLEKQARELEIENKKAPLLADLKTTEFSDKTVDEIFAKLPLEQLVALHSREYEEKPKKKKIKVQDISEDRKENEEDQEKLKEKLESNTEKAIAKFGGK